MNISILHLALSSGTDFHRLHSICLQVAKWAGLDDVQQLYFAFSVIDKCNLHLQNPKEIEFLVTGADSSSLKVTIKNKEILLDAIEVSLSSAPDLINKPVIAENITADEAGWKPEYQDLLNFHYALSHDLKNSLAKLKLAHSLLEEETVPPNLKFYLDIIHRSSVNLENTMMSLNKIIKLGHSSHEVVSHISPANIFEEVLQDYAGEIQELQTDFEATASISYIEVYLKSFFANLVSNAVKYASPERPLVLTIKSRREDGVVILSFTDNGQGIDLTAHGAKLFQPFTRFNHKANGTGIGLYLVKNMIERNGGKIEVESQLNSGTTFKFYLREYQPVVQPEQTHHSETV